MDGSMSSLVAAQHREIPVFVLEPAVSLGGLDVSRIGLGTAPTL
ncbi:hypothetical protein AB0G67_48370 [Streptomyces sp. NPDC021056]